MGYELYDWTARFNHEGLTYGLRIELIELLRPHVKLKSAFQASERDELGEPTRSNAPVRIKDLVDWEIVLETTEVHEILGTLQKNHRWLDALPELLPSLSSLLLEALDLMRQLEGANDRSDGSYWHQPSIAEHPQNQKFRDWTALIDLTRDAFLATATVNAERARAEVDRWLTCPYPLFRRLAFFAATETDLFTADVSLQWLLADQNWWLWSVETEREALRLVVKLGKTLANKDAPLLSAILRGPPREMFLPDTDSEKLLRVADREIWLRLSKYTASGDKNLSGEAADTFARISKKFPEWRLEADESDEFPVWMGESEDWYRKQNSPKELSALQDWLLAEHGEMTNDDWSDRCKDDFSIAVLALIHLAQRTQWPVQRWRTALQVWSDQSLVLKSWDQLKNQFAVADDNIIKALAQPLSWWLQAVGKVLVEGEAQFLELIQRVLVAQIQEPFDGGNDPIFKAINHPVGQATDAVFRWWYRQSLEDGQGLKSQPKSIFSELCNLEIAGYRYGRIILAANLIPLFRVDRGWTERYVLRNLDWNFNAEEARAAWSGFLWAPRFLVPLFALIKPQFLATAVHYEALGQFAQQYANLLTYVALEAPEPFKKKELARATSQLPAEGLARCAVSLVQGLDGAGEKRVEYWQNRIRPYLKDIWPKSVDAVTRSVANSFTRLCMKTDRAFPDAVSELKPWLSKATAGDVTLHEFRGTKLGERFPEAALTFLSAVVREDSFYLADDLRVCLDEIRGAKPDLENDPRFERLTRYARQLGG
jgi:hypothetical protein